MSTAELTFSIVINTLDRAKALGTLLRALDSQSHPHFEVIVVVGPTRDDTVGMLREWGDRVRVLRCPEANLSQSRNIGLWAARGDIVAFIDDDAVPSHRWLAQLARLFRDPDLSGTGGKVYFIHPDKASVQYRLGIVSGLAEQVDVRGSYLDELPPPGNGYQWAPRMMGTNMAFRRKDLLEIGGFDEFFQWVYDDCDVALRLANAGRMIHPVQEAVVYHAPASSRNRKVSTAIGNWWIQTRAAIYFTIKHGRRGGNSWRDIALRCLHLWHGHVHWSGRLRRKGEITFAQYLKMHAHEAKGALSGAYHGWRSLRHHETTPPIENQMTEDNRPIKRFQNEGSHRQPGVNPISGERPAITMPNPPLRIGLLSMAYPPDQYEGVGRLTNLMAQGLFELGHTVHVITHGDGESTSFYDGAYVHRISYQRNRYDRYQLFPRLHNVLNYSHAVYDKVRQLQLNDGIQLVDSPLWQMDGLVTAISGTLPVVVRLVTAAKQIAGIQNEVSNDARLLGEMEKILIQRAAHLLPNTKATFSTVFDVYGVETEPGDYTVVPYGIVPAPEEAIRPFPDADYPDTLTVLYVGRLEKRKGIADLFAAIPTVLSRVPDARFVIVGADNSHQDGFQKKHGVDYVTYFKQKYPEYARHVTFTGAVNDKELNRQYQKCDLFVAPSLYESFGLIYLEAMNYAKPVIGCNTGGVPEVVDHGQDGLLVDPEAPKQLASAIVQLLESPEKLREMGLAAREHLLQDFTHVAMACRFAAVYKKIITNHRN